MPLVSVIIPAFRSADFISIPVGSVLRQTWQDFEIIIGSDDGQDYKAILAAQGMDDPRIRCVKTGGVGTGPASARNKAMAAASGRIIAALDSDDMLRADTFEILVPKVLEHGGAYSDVAFRHFNSDMPLPNYNRKMPTGLLSLEEVLTSCVHTYVWIMFDRERMPDARWHEGIPIFNDVFFYAWCCDRLGHLWYTPEQLYVYHRRPGSICNTPGLEQKLIQDCAYMEQELDKGTLLSNATVGTGEVMKKYIGRWKLLEQLCIDAMAAGTYTDYQDFLRDHRDLLYHLS